MPLNIEESGPNDTGTPDVPKSGPEPGERKRIYPWLLLILALSSGVFLLFQFGVLPPGRGRSAAVSPRTATAPDTAVPVRIPPETPVPAPTPAPTPKPTEAARRNAAPGEGKYTIVISAFSSSVDAEEMAGRWAGAGFEAGVQHASGWYRVTLGRYRTVGEARQEAERLKQALEEGYWITRISI